MELTIYTPIITTPVQRSIREPWLSRHSDKSLLLLDFVFRVVDEQTRVEEVIVIPKGYIFDWSSIPRPLWSLFPPSYSQSRYGSLAHDYLYSHLHHHYSKDFADRLFRAFMHHFKAPTYVEVLFYNAVKYFGRGGWTQREKPNAHSHWKHVYEKVDYHTLSKDPLLSTIEPFLYQELAFIDGPSRVHA